MRAVIALAVTFLAVAAAFQIFDGAQVVGAGMLRGLHDTRVPMLFAAVRLLGGRARLRRRGWRSAQDWRGVGIWVGLAAGLAIVVGADAVALARGASGSG